MRHILDPEFDRYNALMGLRQLRRDAVGFNGDRLTPIIDAFEHEAIDEGLDFFEAMPLTEHERNTLLCYLGRYYEND